MKKKSTTIVPTMLRIRESLRRRLEHEAKKNEQSLNAEIIRRLEQSFAEQRDSDTLDMLINSWKATRSLGE